MKLFFFWLLALSQFQLLAQGTQTIPVRPASSWIKEYHYQDDLKDTANTSGGYYNLLYDDQYNAPLKESYHHYVQKILSERGLENISTISNIFDPSYEALTFHSIDIIRDGRKINQLTLGTFQVLKREASLERLVYDGNLTAVFNLHDAQVGDIVEYSFTVKGSNPAFGNKFSRLTYFNFSVPVSQVVFRLVTKSDHPFEIKKINSPPQESVTKNGDQIIYEWVAKDVPALLQEESSPGWYDPYDHIHVSDFGSWGEMGKWADNLFKMDDIPTGLLSKVPGVQKENKEQAIRKVIQFVQDEVRYLSFSEGIHGFKPHPPSKILSQRFGDCKDKSVLLASLLRELGLTSYPVLVNTGYGKALPDYLPSPLLFNHCIVQFSYHDSIYWVDPTITFQRGSLKELYFPPYHNGLVINKDTNALIPLPDSKEPTLFTEENFYLDRVGGSARFSVKTTYTRQEADNMRSYFESNSLNEIEKQYLNFYATDYPEISKGKQFKWTDDELNNIIVSEENYQISSFWVYDSLTKKNTATVYPRNLSTYLITPKTKIRQSPYSLNYPLNISQHIDVHMPEEWNVKPALTQIESPGFSYTNKTGYHDKIIELSFRYRVKKPYLEKSEVKEFISKLDEVSNDLNFSITYTAPEDLKGSFNYPFLAILLVALAISYFGFKYAYDWNPEPKLSSSLYRSIGGWLILPALGFCLTPLQMTYQLFSSVDYFEFYYWSMLTDPSYASYRPSMGIFALGEMIANFLFLVYSVFVIYMFFTRRTSVPYLAVIFYLANLLLQGGDTVVASLLGTEPDGDTIKSIARAFVGAVIWIPYFLSSDRSRGTFTIRTTPPPDQQQIYQLRD